MSTAERKARKRAGIKFVKPAKVGTPLEERAWFAAPVFGPSGTRLAFVRQERSENKRRRAVEARRVSAPSAPRPGKGKR